MLNAFSCEGGRPKRVSQLQDLDALREAMWIDLLTPTQDEIKLVTAATQLTVPTQDELSEIESSSRLATRDGVLYLSMPLVSLADGPRLIAAGFVLAPERLLTVRFAASRGFDAFIQRAEDREPTNHSSAHVLTGLLEAIVDRQADSLEQVRADLDTISHNIFAMGMNEQGGRKLEDALLRRTLGRLGQIGDLISHIRESQVAAARIVPYIESSAAEWLPKDLNLRLRTLRRDIESISDFDTHLNDKLQFLLDATLGFISIAQNNVMKVLTVVSVAGVPPVLVAGIYGMNFKVMPELDWAWGYPYGLALIVLTTLIPLAWFKLRGWI